MWQSRYRDATTAAPGLYQRRGRYTSLEGEVTERHGERGRPSDHDTGSMTGQDELAQRMSELARELQQTDSSDAPDHIVKAAIDLVPGAEEGSISDVVGRRYVKSKAASSELPRRVDELMNQVGEGPCLDAIYDQETVRVPDLRAETRWPRYSAAAAELGARSVLSFQLYVEGDNLGALNLYSTRPDAFGDDDEHIGLLVATHAAIAYAGVRRQAQLNRGMATRDVIGQAKGILMERFAITGHTAFRVLVRYSQDRNVKLYDVALQVVRQREDGAGR